MIQHSALGANRFTRARALWKKIRNEEVTMAGNMKLKIYGRLDCRSGKKMKVKNRVFFENEAEAMNCGYRPCAVCMREKYLLWKG
ncbi:Ada metal-binding domain-containing protein [Emticicia sp. 21SJ11W-3]|uniref:Ada metal-binding domain-containing protein n=1 Tax=Emticicia sp. 21SJ11W-3 TaxID=2916755 RepID=UPI00209D2427|nr:Ada metal-binding domain-containing protein [Emticicia sp. 21SJ11W-3]UTA68274.1 metal-binding protein [Emticicia sp. 21SJ11W-3]